MCLEVIFVLCNCTGQYGVPRPWYFPFQKSYWFEVANKKVLEVDAPGTEQRASHTAGRGAVSYRGWVSEARKVGRVKEREGGREGEREREGGRQEGREGERKGGREEGRKEGRGRKEGKEGEREGERGRGEGGRKDGRKEGRRVLTEDSKSIYVRLYFCY